jgi:hypothetical protein
VSNDVTSNISDHLTEDLLREAAEVCDKVLVGSSAILPELQSSMVGAEVCDLRRPQGRL